MNPILKKLEDNMLLFGKVCIPTMFTQPSPAFHRELIDILSVKENRLVNIQAPRGSAKTSIIGGLFPLHHIMFHKEPKVILLCSKTQSHAALMMRTICDVLDYSLPFRQIFGYWGQHSARKWTNTEVVLKDGTYITCKGTGQQVRGLKFGNQRPTLIIIDDPEDENNTKTTEAMENNLKWVLQAVVPSRDAQTGRVIIIGTPLHERCIVKTLEKASGWLSRVYRYINTDDKGRQYSLWPEQKSLEQLLKDKSDFEEMGKLSWFYREWQCELIGDSDQLFREQDFQYWDGFLTHGDEAHTLIITHLNKLKLEQPIKKTVNVFMGVDPASSIKATADFSTVVAIAYDQERNRYVLPYFRKRVTPLHLATSVIDEWKRYKPIRTKIETNGYQEMLREYVRMESERQSIYIAGLEVGEKARMEKSLRLEGLQPFFAEHKMFIKEDMQDLIDELLMYPRSRHDDLLDGLFYACRNNFVPISDRTTMQQEVIDAEKEEWEYYPQLLQSELRDLDEDYQVA